MSPDARAESKVKTEKQGRSFHLQLRVRTEQYSGQTELFYSRLGFSAEVPAY